MPGLGEGGVLIQVTGFITVRGDPSPTSHEPSISQLLSVCPMGQCISALEELGNYGLLGHDRLPLQTEQGAAMDKQQNSCAV